MSGFGNSSRPDLLRGSTCFAALTACSLMMGCTTIDNDYLVDDQMVKGPRQASHAIAEAVNASMPSPTADPRLALPLLRAVAPVMPRDAIEGGIEGSVQAVLLVTAAGKVSEVQILQSPHPILSEAVVKAMQQWVFAPSIVDGVPSAFKVQQTYTFRIED